MSTNTQSNDTVLVIGATGKAGRRVAERSTARGTSRTTGERAAASGIWARREPVAER